MSQSVTILSLPFTDFFTIPLKRYSAQNIWVSKFYLIFGEKFIFFLTLKVSDAFSGAPQRSAEFFSCQYWMFLVVSKIAMNFEFTIIEFVI